MKWASEQENAEFPDHFRLIPYVPTENAGVASNVSTPNDITDALRNPSAGWPGCAVTFPTGTPRMKLNNLPRYITSGGIPNLHTLARASNDPVALALEAYRTEKDPPREFRTLDSARALETPHGQHHRRIPVRFGPSASREATNSQEGPPPTLRRVGVREVLDVPSVPGQDGYPASMNTYARPGYSVMGYQSSESACTLRDVVRDVLAL